MARESDNFEKMRVKIIVRAWKDPRFKEKLLKNPRAAFKEMGVDLPENFQVNVVADQTNSMTFVLPPPIEGLKQLSDAELERLAGGRTGTGDSCNPNKCHTQNPYECPR